jgi:hypothetical protein
MRRITDDDALIKFVSYIVDSTDYLLKIDVAIAAMELPLIVPLPSHSELARKHGISRQAFNKHVHKFRKDFKLDEHHRTSH